MEELLEVYLLDHPVDTAEFPHSLKWLESTGNLVTSQNVTGYSSEYLVRKFSYAHLRTLKRRLEADIEKHAEEDRNRMWKSETGENLRSQVDIFLNGGGDPEVVN